MKLLNVGVTLTDSPHHNQHFTRLYTCCHLQVDVLLLCYILFLMHLSQFERVSLSKCCFFGPAVDSLSIGTGWTRCCENIYIYIYIVKMRFCTLSASSINSKAETECSLIMKVMRIVSDIHLHFKTQDEPKHELPN